MKKDKQGMWKLSVIPRLLAGVMCFWVFSFSAMAEGEGPATNVWMDVVVGSTEDRISVTVPLSFGFAVVGSLDSIHDTVGVSVADGTVLVPNVLVKVMKPSELAGGSSGPGNAKYEIAVSEDPFFPVRNYSTFVEEDIAGEEERKGMAVELSPMVTEMPEYKGNKHYWVPVKAEPKAVEEDFKKYRIKLDEQPLSITDTIKVMDKDGTIRDVDVIRMDGKIGLEAPPDMELHGYTAAGTANMPAERYLSADIEVGGIRSQYKQVEASVKAGEIWWLVETVR